MMEHADLLNLVGDMSLVEFTCRQLGPDCYVLAVDGQVGVVDQEVLVSFLTVFMGQEV